MRFIVDIESYVVDAKNASEANSKVIAWIKKHGAPQICETSGVGKREYEEYPEGISKMKSKRVI